MIVRKIRPEELKRAQELSAHAFEYRMADADKSAQEITEQAAHNAQCTEALTWQDRWAAFEDDDKRMMSVLHAIAYQAHFDGHVVPMVGIGGVSTLPQYRRCGGIRACFEAALPAMYEQGAVFSYLYPFSTVFYRKFGYELGCECNRYKLRLGAIPKRAVDGSCHLVEPGAQLRDDVMAIDAIWQKRYNMMTIDAPVDYSWMDTENPFRDVIYTYVYRDAQGAPKGYVRYKPVTDEGDRAVECMRFMFADAEGFYGLLGLLQTLASDHSHAILRLPTDVELGALLPEWSQGAVICRREQRGMLRVVNAEHALCMARMRGTGSLTLEITDAQIAQNNGRFHVRFDEGVTTSVVRVDDAPDIVMTIQEFARLIAGRYDMKACAYLPDVRLLCDASKAAKVFYEKPLYITRGF